MIKIRRYMQYQMGGLVLLIGLAFSLGGYALMSKVAEGEAETALRLITKESGSAMDQLLLPATTLLKLLANVPDLKSGVEADWMLRLPAQASILRDQPMLTSIYVGGPQGQFLLLRILRNDWDRNRFQAPPESRWMVQLQRVSKTEGEVQYWIYLDEKFHILNRKRATGTEDYDPRTRPWYQASRESEGVLRTKAYTFYTTGKTGITLANNMRDGWVIAMDIHVESLEPELARLATAYAAHIALFEQGGAMVSADLGEKNTGDFFKMLVEKEHVADGKDLKWMVDPDGQYWWMGTAKVQIDKYDEFLLHVAVPRDRLLAKALKLRNFLLAVTLLITLLTLLLARRNAARISYVFQTLADRANALVNFDFRQFDHTETRITEIAQLEIGLERARTSASNFLRLLEKVSRESDFEKLLPLVMEETTDAAHGEYAWFYINDGSSWNLRAQRGDREGSTWLSKWLTLLKEGGGTLFHADESVNGRHVLMLPLSGRRGQLLGLLVIERSAPFSEHHRSFVEALSGFAALTLESRELVAQQKQLFESFIKLLAEAVDAKSPHTGGHCHRVPILTEWLAELAERSDASCVADFKLDEEMREAVHIAAWLHDCGKVVTPEYVVDKATKLETLYDRIHEIRMRFEVCKREAELTLWKVAYPEGLPVYETEQLALELKALDEDFAFVAGCNLGSEKMSDDAIGRIKQIATRTWTRTIDDRLGLSHDEIRRRCDRSTDSLPTQEYLLSDQPEHQVTRPQGQSFTDDNPWGFRMQVPELLYDRGEVKNLSIQRGTLTDEERYKINEHIVLTIKMLEAMPFPRHLMSVPEIAGGHHERTDSRGYPRAIPASSMSIPARMMAIADVFEALTATDRPYKPGKSVDESLDIMHKMACGGHLDVELFELFAQSDIPARYAAQFLMNGDH
jgi:HD-GYP domain-containing protein (c-di-GMP phosphodiesterase class II)